MHLGGKSGKRGLPGRGMLFQVVIIIDPASNRGIEFKQGKVIATCKKTTSDRFKPSLNLALGISRQLHPFGI